MRVWRLAFVPELIIALNLGRFTSAELVVGQWRRGRGIGRPEHFGLGLLARDGID